MLFLDNANHVINFENVSVGGISATYVDVRLIYKRALLYNAVSIIVAHNHPSEQLRPSRADELLTERLAEAGKFLDIKLHDHLIVGGNGYYSFAAEGKL